MFVNRITRVVKKGHLEEAVALVKSEMERFPPPHGTRIYTGYAAPIDTVVIDFEFESLDELEKHWAGWFADPATVNFNQKFDAITETRGANEIWNLA